MSRKLLTGIALVGLFLLPACSKDRPLPTGTTQNGLSASDPATTRWGGVGLTNFFSFSETAVTGFVDFMRIDPVSGHGTILWRLGVDPPAPDFSVFPTPLGLTFDLDGTMYTIVDWINWNCPPMGSRLARVDFNTGAVTYIGPMHPLHFSGPEIGPDGVLYACGFEKPDQFTGAPVFCGDTYLYRFDKWTGEATPIGLTGITVDAVMDLAFDSRGRLWATTANKLFLLDTQTGHGTFVTDIKGVPQDHPPLEVMTIAFNDADVLYGTAIIGFCSDYCGPAPVMTIDVATGQATLIGDTGQMFNHGGDMLPNRVNICHRTANGWVPLTVSLAALPQHRAHGDYVPGVDGPSLDCPTSILADVPRAPAWR
jgi:hypothetical protein